jgi:DNA-binding Lrp family transcriptional regulator
MLKPQDYSVLTRLYRLAQGFRSTRCQVSNTRLAKACNVSERELRRILSRLEGHKLITRVGIDLSNTKQTDRGLIVQVNLPTVMREAPANQSGADKPVAAVIQTGADCVSPIKLKELNKHTQTQPQQLAAQTQPVGVAGSGSGWKSAANMPTISTRLALEPKKRNRVMLRTLYYAGLRVSELCGLCWRDLQARGETEGQLTAFGKGGKTRAVLLPACLWSELVDLRGGAEENEPVFRSRLKPGSLDPSQVMRVVRAAALRVGIKSKVSPHWLRHAHASHALDRGAPIHLVQATLGHASVSTTGRYLHARPTESSSKYLAV